MSIRAVKPGSWINDLFPKGPTERQLQDCFNIWWRICLMHIPPRDTRYEFDRDWGMGQIDAVMEHLPIKLDHSVSGGGQQIMFVFPERWMSTQEEYMFVPMLKSHPQIVEAKLTIIDIVTKSPLIIGNFLKDDVRIVSADDSDGTARYDGGITKASRTAWDIAQKKERESKKEVA